MRTLGMMAAGVAVSAAIQTASGAELVVPSKQYPTIQAAVNAAVDGDTVVLGAGVFTESVQLSNTLLTIQGAGADQTTWHAPNAAPCIPPQPNNTKPISLVGIHFTGFNMPSYPHAAVALNWVASHVVSRCAFTNCTFFALNIWGGGLVEDCKFSGTVGGIAVNTNLSSVSSPHVFRNCAFVDNQYDAGFPATGSAMDIYQSTVRLERCTFARNNYPFGNGLAVRVVASSLAVSSTVFCESSAAPISGGWTDGGGNAFTSGSCAPPCTADLVNDGAINAADMAIVLNFWGTDGSQFPGVDIDGDGVVDGADLAAVLNAWGPCPQ